MISISIISFNVRCGQSIRPCRHESRREYFYPSGGRVALADESHGTEARLAQGVRSIRYGKGEILFRQDDPGDELFLISSGTLDIFVVNGRKVEEKIALVGVGSFVGERSLLTGEPRSATARAAGDCSVFVVGKAAMGELLREHSALAEQIAETMAERDAQRHQLTREMTNGGTSDDANTLLKRIRAFFAID